jgi:predicted nucleic acid-binding protein
VGSKRTLHEGYAVKVYFDLCVYNRPFDDQTQPRIMMESLGVVTIMALIGGKQIRSINSFVLDYENRKNPKSENRSFIENLLAESSEFVHRNDNIARRAFELEKKGIMGMDALHVACAEEAGADYFVSCDDVLVRRLNKIDDIKVQAVGLLEFISREVF